MKKNLNDWKRETQERQQNEFEAAQRRADEQAKKKKDAEAYTYQVIKDGKIEFSTPREDEAIRTAEKIHAKVLWLIDGAGIRYIYPKE